jgi:hypothetical protein
MNVPSSIIHHSGKEEAIQGPSMSDLIRKMGQIHIIKYNSSIQRNGVLMPRTTCMSQETTGKKPVLNDPLICEPNYEIPTIGKSIETENKLVPRTVRRGRNRE